MRSQARTVWCIVKSFRIPLKMNGVNQELTEWCAMDCYLCGHEVDPDGPATVTINPEPILYAHSHCHDKLERRYNSRLCLTCGETP